MTELRLRTDRSLIGAGGRSDRYVVLTVTAPVAERTRERKPVDIAFVLDRSGSMGGEKIELARDAVLQGLAMLQDRDRFAVVAYDSRIDVVMPLTPATADARATLESRIREIGPRGGTNLGAGWLMGCQQLAGGQNPAGIARCLLMSDGQANEGITNPNELETHASELRRRGVVTSTFGVGADFDERLMSGMARAGGGQGYFIQQVRQIGDLLTSELGEALDIVLPEAAISLQLPDGARLELLSDFDVTQQTGTARIRLGNLVSGQTTSVVLKLRFPAGEEGRSTSLSARVEAETDPVPGASAELSWTLASAADNDSQPRDRAVDVQVATIYAARARREALELNRAGNFDAAFARLEQVAARIKRYAGDSPELLAIISSLVRQRREYSRPMSDSMMKSSHYESLRALHSRSASGKARRTHFDAEQFVVELHNGVPLFTCNGARVAIVTGTPTSFGRTTLHLLGDDYRLPTEIVPGITVDSIGANLRTRIDVILGVDILSRHQCLLDINGNKVVFSRGDLGCDGVSLQTPLHESVPSAALIVGTRRGVALLDTGARLSYMDPSAVAGLPVARETDFFPLLGELETDVFEMDVEFAGLRFRGRFGVLPAPLRHEMTRLGAEWIVGTELLRQFPIVFDLKHHRLLVVEKQPSEVTQVM